jgi:hypothetical protein
MPSDVPVLRVHVAGGTVWFGDETALAEDSGQAPAEFVERFDELGVSLAGCSIRVLGVPENAGLIARLSVSQTAGVKIAAPAVVPSVALRADPEVVLHYLWQPPLTSRMAGLWNTVKGPADYCTYVIMDEIGADGSVSETGIDLLHDHPAWPVLSFAGSDPAASARLVCRIGDPRWYSHPVRPGRWTRLYSRLGLTPAGVTLALQNQIPLPALDAWRSDRKLPPFALVAVAKYGYLLGMLRAAQTFVTAVALVWMDVLRPSGPDRTSAPFDPERLFRVSTVAAAYRKHVCTVGS